MTSLILDWCMYSVTMANSDVCRASGHCNVLGYVVGPLLPAGSMLAVGLRW
jgi:hypothetical protein